MPLVRKFLPAGVKQVWHGMELIPFLGQAEYRATLAVRTGSL